MAALLPPAHATPGVALWCERHFVAFALGVSLLAAVNVGHRLDRESLTEWDEALYGVSAAELVASGQWVDTTFWGRRDYYNSKPPLNAWLIATSFRAWGPGLAALRLPSAVAGWATVVVLMIWARRAFGADTALVAGLVLSTSFGFFYVHSARTGNTDALFTLLVTLTVIALWAARDDARRLLWLGPILALTFLLRGPGVLMPVAIVGLVELGHPHVARRWPWHAAAAAIALLPVTAWAWRRWRLDGWLFFNAMVMNDLVGVATKPLDGHHGGVLFYLDVMQRYHYDWLIAGAIAWTLAPRKTGDNIERTAGTARLCGAWAAVTFGVPTLLQTKTSWYLTPFYPVFALAIGAVSARGLSPMPGTRSSARRRTAVVVLLAATAMTAEGRMVWRSFRHRDIRHSVQGVLLAERAGLAGRRVFRERWNHADRFVLEKVVGGKALVFGPEADATTPTGGDVALVEDAARREWRLVPCER